MSKISIIVLPPKNGEFSVVRTERLATFFDEARAQEYAALENQRLASWAAPAAPASVPAVDAAPAVQAPPLPPQPPEPVNFDEIWAKAASGDVSR